VRNRDIRSASSPRASSAGWTYSGGAIARLTATPTAAPISVSYTRPSATFSLPPTASTIIALIGTSSRFAPRRSILPTTSEPATTSPRLHQVKPTTSAIPTATNTPASTLSTRPKPEATVSYSVSCTTRSAVSGASTGAVLVSR